MTVYKVFTLDNCSYSKKHYLSSGTVDVVKFKILIIITFSTIFRLNFDFSVVCGGGNWSPQQKPPPNPKSLTIFSLAPAGFQTWGVARNIKQSVAKP